MSLTVYGGPDDGRYSTRIVGSANSRRAQRDADGAIHIVISPDEPAEPGVAWIRLEPDAVAAITRDYLDDPFAGPAGRLAHRGRRPARDATARTMPTWPGASAPPRPGSASRPASCPSPWARPTPSTRPTRCRPPPSAGPPATPPTPWAPSSWPTTRPWSSGAARPSASSGTCACGTAFLHTYNYDYERVTINGAQVSYEPDGSWIIVVSARRPAHPNWVSTAGPPIGPHLVPLVPARPRPPSSPRSRSCPVDTV